MRIGGKYKITTPEEYFIDHKGKPYSFGEIVRRVEILETSPQWELPSRYKFIMVECLDSNISYPLVLNNNLIIEEIN